MSDAHRVREALQGATIAEVHHLVDTSKRIDRLTLKLADRQVIEIEASRLKLRFANALRAPLDQDPTREGPRR